MKKEDRASIFVKKVLSTFHIKVNSKTLNLFIQIFKFTIVGGTAFIIDFGFLWLFREIFKIPVIISTTLSFCISVVYNYIASVKWVFDVDNKKDKKKVFITFIIFSVLGLILNDLIMWLGTDMFNIHYLITKIIATAIVMVFNFITRKMFLE